MTFSDFAAVFAAGLKVHWRFANVMSPWYAHADEFLYTCWFFFLEKRQGQVPKKKKVGLIKSASGYQLL